jgi:succinate dehydrogenase/fumarate reductase flavoprotein subunit
VRTVAVVGSGAAGLVAALAAAKAGARAIVYEWGDRIGGTTALSGGNGWLPANPYIRDDSPEAALAYLRALSLGDVDDGLLQVFVREAGPTAAWIERETPVRLQPIAYCDYHAELPGGREQGGRTLEPLPLDPSPRAAELVRDAPNVTAPVTYVELATGELDRDEVARRRQRGTLTLGRALVAGLVEACLDAGVEIRTGLRVRELPQAGAVVLATGGFERDPQLVKAFLRGPMVAPVGVPTARGDGLRLAVAAGAALGSMSEAWWCPAAHIPGETIDGEPLYRLILTERARPGCLLVNGRGVRFVDEAQNYNDLGRALQNFDPVSYSFPNAAAWLVFDGGYRRTYRLGPLSRRDPDPEWLARGETLAELAGAISVPTAALEGTVASFNEGAARGEDAQFGRGTVPYDRFIGSLGPLAEPPYYAFRVLPGCLGTKGGPRVDADGRVLSMTTGEPIPRLFAAGNAAACPFGLAYPGAGGTLGPAFVFGLRAGEAAAAEAS